MLVPRLHEQMRARFDPELTIADIFKYPVLENMAAFIDARAPAGRVGGSPTTTARDKGNRARKQLDALRRNRKKRVGQD